MPTERTFAGEVGDTYLRYMVAGAFAIPGGIVYATLSLRGPVSLGIFTAIMGGSLLLALVGTYFVFSRKSTRFAHRTAGPKPVRGSHDAKPRSAA